MMMMMMMVRLWSGGSWLSSVIVTVTTSTIRSFPTLPFDASRTAPIVTNPTNPIFTLALPKQLANKPTIKAGCRYSGT
jgi:hypothetical protein